MLSGGAHTGGFTRDGPAPSKELCRSPEPAVWRCAADWGRAGLVGVGGRRHRRNFGDMNDARTFRPFYHFHAPWVTACERRRDARPPEMQKFAHAIQALQTLVLLRAGAKLQLPRLTLHHNVDIACSALVGADVPSQSSAPSRDSSGTLLRHSCCVIYYDSCACAAGRDHLAALNVGRDASPKWVFLSTQHQHQCTATTLSLSSSTGASAVFAHLVPLPPSPPRQPLHTRLHHCAGRARAHTLRQSSLAHAAQLAQSLPT